MDVGAELRRAREQRALSLEDLSRRTKISVPALRALEGNEVERLPGGIFTRGFVKAFAREVGLDPEDVWHRYEAQFEPVVVAPPPVEAAQPATAATDSQQAGDPRGAQDRVAFARVARVIALVALIALSYFELTRSRSSGPPEGVESARGKEVVSTAGGSQKRGTAAPRPETATTGSLEAAPPSPAASDLVLHVELHPPLTCWVSATADGRRVMYRLMVAGERQAIEARDELVLRVGDAARFGYSINGSPGAPLGPAGQPATVRMTPRNYRRFLGQ